MANRIAMIAAGDDWADDMTDAAADIARSMEAIRVGIEQVSQQGERPRAHSLKDAIEVLAQAKAHIDQLTELLRYFTRLGDSEQLRDFREVRSNLLRSRALLSTQQDVAASLTQAAAGLAKLIEESEIRKKQVERNGGPSAPAPGTEAASTAPPTEAAPPSPAPMPDRKEAHEQKIVNEVFSEIESILRRPG